MCLRDGEAGVRAYGGHAAAKLGFPGTESPRRLSPGDSLQRARWPDSN